MEHFAHLSERQSSSARARGRSDVEILLRGTPEQIADRVANAVRIALGNGEISEIRLIPVAPWSVFDLEQP